MYWANFLHIYQPPTQKSFWVKKIADESYRKIVQELKKSPKAKLTLNISAILVELFERDGCLDIVQDLKNLLEKGQIELTASAKYHPLLPKLPKDEIVRQIELNTETHKKYFGDAFKPKGFFPPEMGYSNEIAKIAADLGYQWIIVDELSFPKKDKNEINYRKIYEVTEANNIKIFFRERKMSYKILSGQLGTGNLLIDSLGQRLNNSEYLLTAMDGETFGHHRPGMEQLLFEIYKSKKLETVVISDLPNYFKETEKITPLPSTWALMEKDLEKNAPFSRWDDPGNEIHETQWKLFNLAIEIVKSNQGDQNYPQARKALDRALHSDQFWWASAKPWWSLEMIEAGAKELKDVIQMLNSVPTSTKEKAQKLYQDIIFTGFEWQRSGRVEALSKQEDEEVRQMTDEAIPELPKEEIDKIVKNLEKEILVVIKRQEFERAAQLRDRIKELRRYQI